MSDNFKGSDRFKIFAVLGQSQHGKSSFINLLSGCTSQAVGCNDGRSCTVNIHSVRFPDWFELLGSPETELRFFDVPGFGDTELRFTNRQILEGMKVTLAGLESRQFDGLFVFQSLAESSINLKGTLERIETMFGERVYRSTVVIMTKSDLLPPLVMSKKRTTVERVCQEKRLPCLLWINNSAELGDISSSQKATQISALRTTLPQLLPYEVMDMKEYEQLVKQRAKLMMARDTSNTVTKTVQVPTQRAVTTKEKEIVMEQTLKPVYTEEEVKRRALEERARPENRRAEVMVSTKEVDDFEYQVITSTETVSNHDSHLLGAFSSSSSYTLTNQRVEKIPIKRRIQESEVQYVSQPAVVFEPSLRNQTKVVEEAKERVVEKVKVEDELVERTVTTTRNDLSHYEQKAAKQLARERMQNREEDASTGP